MVSGVRRCEHITPVLEDLHWLPISQRVVFKTALLVWKCVRGVAPVYLRDLCISAAFVEGRQRLRSAATGALLVPRAQTATGQRSFAVNGPTGYRLEQSATSTTFARSVAERLQAGTEDSSLLIRPATLSRFRDFAAAYKSADLLTYLHC